MRAMPTSCCWKLFPSHSKAFSRSPSCGIYVAQTGGASTVYDGSQNSSCNSFDETTFCYPVINSPTPKMTATPNGTQPNSFVLYNFGNSLENQDTFCAAAANQLACTAQLNNLQSNRLSPRNLFRTPGIWNMDVGVLKNFKLPWEGKKLQFRAEFFNLFNHSNLYAVAGTNQLTGAASQVLAVRGLTNDGRTERRNIQLALRLAF